MEKWKKLKIDFKLPAVTFDRNMIEKKQFSDFYLFFWLGEIHHWFCQAVSIPRQENTSQ